jgi:AcrR family transcriptional regulator
MPAARPPTRSERQAQTRAALLQAAADAFIERGFQGTSVEEIAHRAGFTRGAFYSNFSSKEQLFAELLQERVFSVYRAVAEAQDDPLHRLPLRKLGESIAALQDDPGGRWLFRLWLETLAHAVRSEDFRAVAAEFWRGTRELGAKAVADFFAERGVDPPADPKTIASGFIALDIGLAIQHYVDPDDAPSSLWPDLYETLFGPYTGGVMP